MYRICSALLFLILWEWQGGLFAQTNPVLADVFRAKVKSGETLAAQQILTEISNASPDDLWEILPDIELLYGFEDANGAEKNDLLAVYQRILDQKGPGTEVVLLKRALLLYSMANTTPNDRLEAYGACLSNFQERTPLMLVEEIWKAQGALQRNNWIERLNYYTVMEKVLWDRRIMRPEEDREIQEVLDRMIHEIWTTMPDCQALAARIDSLETSGALDASAASAILTLANLRFCENEVDLQQMASHIGSGKQTPEIARLLTMIQMNFGSKDQYKNALLLWLNAEEKPLLKAAVRMEYAKMLAEEQYFPEAKKQLEKVIQENPNWGEPWLLYADLVVEGSADCALSDFDRKVVYWLAADFCQQAKNRDQNANFDADRRLFSYQGLMPTHEEALFRGYRVGDTYPIRCWISKVTTVR